MDREELVKALEARLAEKAESFFRRNEKRLYIDVPPEHTLEANRIVFEDLGGRLATATGMDIRDRVEVLYHYCFDAQNIVVTVRTWGEKPMPEVDSVAQIFPGADFIEREMYDLLGIKFRGHPDPRRLILADDWPEGVFPYRRDYPARGGEKERERLAALVASFAEESDT